VISNRQDELKLNLITRQHIIIRDMRKYLKYLKNCVFISINIYIFYLEVPSLKKIVIPETYDCHEIHHYPLMQTSFNLHVEVRYY